MRTVPSVLLAIAALGTLTATSRAGFILTFTESGGNVVATGSGSIDTAGLSFANSIATPPPQVNGSIASALAGATAIDNAYSGATGPANFGSGGLAFASSGTGDAVGIGGGAFIIVPQLYVSGTALSDSATWDGATFASLGLTPGTYTYNFGSGATADFLEIQIGPAATAAPEPASLTLLGLGVAGLAGYGWRRRVKA
jgi:hypothetical protein